MQKQVSQWPPDLRTGRQDDEEFQNLVWDIIDEILVEVLTEDVAREQEQLGVELTALTIMREMPCCDEHRQAIFRWGSSITAAIGEQNIMEELFLKNEGSPRQSIESFMVAQCEAALASFVATELKAYLANDRDSARRIFDLEDSLSFDQSIAD